MQGRRLQKNIGNGGISNTINYVYDSGDVIEEQNGAGALVKITDGSTITQVTIRLDLVIRNNGTNYWPHGDAEGSAMALTLDNGSVTERYDYTDFGEPAFFNGSGTSIAVSAVGNSHLFKGLPYES